MAEEDERLAYKGDPLDVAGGKIRRLAEIHGAAGARLAWNPHP